MRRCVLTAVTAVAIVACGVPGSTAGNSSTNTSTGTRTSTSTGTRTSTSTSTNTGTEANPDTSTTTTAAPPDVLVEPPTLDVTDRSACRSPTSLIVSVIYLHTSAPLSAGETPPPDLLDTQTLYIAGGPAGLGVLCHGSTTHGPPALSAAMPRPGAIPYLVEDDWGIWGAVGPQVARVDLTLAGYHDGYSFTVGNPVATLDLRLLGGGWHAFNTAVGFSPRNPEVTAVAYDAAGHRLGTRTIGRHR